MNFLRMKTSLLFAAAFLAAPTFTACSSDSPDSSVGDAGTLGLRLAVGDRDIDTVHYEISRPGYPTIEGDLNVESARTLSFRIGGLPAGTGYTIVLTATTTDGELSCSGSAPFDVVAGRVTSVSITLSCSDATGTLGSIDVNGSFNQCPVITSLVASPLEANVGESISLTATAEDSDDTDTVAYSWADEDGVFADAASAEYACDSEGEHTLVLNVNDGNCIASESVTVRCVSDDDTGETTDTDETETTETGETETTETGETETTETGETETTETGETETTETGETETTETGETETTETGETETTETGETETTETGETETTETGTDETETDETETGTDETETTTEDTETELPAPSSTRRR